MMLTMPTVISMALKPTAFTRLPLRAGPRCLTYFNLKSQSFSHSPLPMAKPKQKAASPMA